MMIPLAMAASAVGADDVMVQVHNEMDKAFKRRRPIAIAILKIIFEFKDSILSGLESPPTIRGQKSEIGSQNRSQRQLLQLYRDLKNFSYNFGIGVRKPTTTISEKTDWNFYSATICRDVQVVNRNLQGYT